LAALGITRKVEGGDDWKLAKNSDLVVITSGSPRKPGMTRADLEEVNAKIVNSVCKSLKPVTPSSLFLIVTNPVEKMTESASKTLGLSHNRVFGLSGVLDSARYSYFLQEKFSTDQAAGMVVGLHNDEMVPLISQTSVNNLNTSKVDLKEVIDRTKKGGAQITELLGTSAYFAPAAAIFKMVEAVVNDTGEVLPTVVLADGKYGLKDKFIGLPAKLGKNGASEIIELNLTKQELEKLQKG
jgi:malate dehydrogenase